MEGREGGGGDLKEKLEGVRIVADQSRKINLFLGGEGELVWYQ